MEFSDSAVVEDHGNLSESYYIHKYHDVMTKEWFWYRTPFPVICTLVGYWVFVFYLGPRLMKNRQPFDLKYALRAYNLLQIAHNLGMMVWAFTEPLYVPIILQARCLNLNPVDGRAFALNVYVGHYQFFSNKVLDLVDTLFFVLRKKQRHITFLHVFHHVTMVGVVWIFGRYTPGTEAAMAGLVNLAIHIIMYTYYFLASFGNQFAGVLRYKRYLTIMQIAQFIFVLAHSIFALSIGCSRMPIIVKLVMFEEAANLVLFLNFYRKAYGPSNMESMLTKFAFCQLQLAGLFAAAPVAEEQVKRDLNENEVSRNTNANASRLEKKKD